MIWAASEISTVNYSESATTYYSQYYPFINYPFSYYYQNYLTALSTIQVWLNRLASPVTCLFGIPANILTIAIFSLRDCAVSNSAKYYYVVMACMDLLSQLSFYLLQYVGYVAPVAWDLLILPRNNRWFCKIARWIWLSAVQSSSFAMAIFCMERLYVISNPMKARFSKFSRNTVMATNIIIVLSFVTNVYLIIAFDLRTIQIPPYKLCGIGTSVLSFLSSYDTVFYEMIPTVLELVLNIVLSVKVSQIGKQRQSLSKGPKMSSKESSATLALIIVACMHSSIFIPDSIFWTTLALITNVSNAPMSIQVVLFNCAMITTFMCGLMESMNFIVYYTHIKRFRTNLLDMLHCRKS